MRPIGSCVRDAAAGLTLMGQEFSDDDYERADRVRSELVGRGLLAIGIPAILAGAASSWLGIPSLVLIIPVEAISVVLFMRWAKKRTQGLPPLGQVIRPIRWSWIFRRFLIFCVALLVLLAFLALLAQLT